MIRRGGLVSVIVGGGVALLLLLVSPVGAATAADAPGVPNGEIIGFVHLSPEGPLIHFESISFPGDPSRPSAAGEVRLVTRDLDAYREVDRAVRRGTIFAKGAIFYYPSRHRTHGLLVRLIDVEIDGNILTNRPPLKEEIDLHFAHRVVG